MRESMEIIYPRTAAERAMKLQEVLLRATAGKIKWWQAAELMGISDRQMRRWRKRLEEQGPKSLLDRRRGTPSRRRVPKVRADEVLALYREKYFDLNVRHFRGASDRIELHVGEAGIADRRSGEAQGQARGAPQAARAASSAGDDVAHRWQRSPVVSG
jgi:transposase-like protein